MKLNTFWTWILFAALFSILHPLNLLALFGISLDKFEDLSVWWVLMLVDDPANDRMS